MSTLFIFSVLLAGYHFIYEGILLPSFRLSLRYRLYAIRDEVRNLRIVAPDQISDEAFHAIHNSINSMLSILHAIDFSLIRRVDHAIKENPRFKKSIEKKTQFLEAQDSEAVKKIKNEISVSYLIAIALNTGGWAIYLTPFVIIVFLFVVIIGIFNKCKQWLFKRSLALAVIPEEKMIKFIPNYVPSEYY